MFFIVTIKLCFRSQMFWRFHFDFKAVDDTGQSGKFSLKVMGNSVVYVISIWHLDNLAKGVVNNVNPFMEVAADR